MIIEPTLEQYHFYLSRVEGDDTSAIQERRAGFEYQLNSLLTQVEQLSGQKLPKWIWPIEIQNRYLSRRIIHTGWLENSHTNRAYFIEARAYQEIYWLQIGYYQRGEAEPDVFSSLRAETWQPVRDTNWLGNSNYLCGIATNELNDTAASAFQTYLGGIDAPRQLTKFPDRLAWYSTPQMPVAVLLYPDKAAEAWAGRTLLNDLIIRLELYRHKVARQLDWCEINWPILTEQEQQLRPFLVQAHTLSNPAVRQLTQLAQLFNSNVGLLVERETTIDINLNNLDTVARTIETFASNDHWVSIRKRFRERQEQLKADLRYADNTRRQADSALTMKQVSLGLDLLLNNQDRAAKAVSFQASGWPGAPALTDELITPPPSDVNLPATTALPIEIGHLRSPLQKDDRALLSAIFHGFGRVMIEKEYGGGYGGARVLLTLPIAKNGIRAARKVTKLGSAYELSREQINFEQRVRHTLPYCAARVESDRYSEMNGQAGLIYTFVGEGALGQTLELETYYQQAASQHNLARLENTFDKLFNKELGQRWYSQTQPLNCFFATEYGSHLVEHLRLRLPSLNKQPESANYLQLDVNELLHRSNTIAPGSLVFIRDLMVLRIRPTEIKLVDSLGLGLVIRVEVETGNNAFAHIRPGDLVDLAGEIIYNRHARLRQIITSAFPAMTEAVNSEFIQLPETAGQYPNPYLFYPQLLARTLEGYRACVHGDLHWRNVLVDESGQGWLIDFARVGDRHNLFDFIKLETYLRLMILSQAAPGFSLTAYTQFEQALTNQAFNQKVDSPSEPALRFAYDTVGLIRTIARQYMAPGSSFGKEYLPALFLYCLSAMKYFQADYPVPTRLLFTSACVLGQALL